jgi:hypothetical protein
MRKGVGRRRPAECGFGVAELGGDQSRKLQSLARSSADWPTFALELENSWIKSSNTCTMTSKLLHLLTEKWKEFGHIRPRTGQF